MSRCRASHSKAPREAAAPSPRICRLCATKPKPAPSPGREPSTSLRSSSTNGRSETQCFQTVRGSPKSNPHRCTPSSPPCTAPSCAPRRGSNRSRDRPPRANARRALKLRKIRRNQPLQQPQPFRPRLPRVLSPERPAGKQPLRSSLPQSQRPTLDLFA